MKCGQFKSVVDDYARGRLAGPAQGQAAEHAARCPVCNALLVEQRALDSALRSLAEAARDEQPGPALESALRVAFRAQAVERLRTQPPPSLIARILAGHALGSRASSPAFLVTLGVAASLVVALGFVVLKVSNPASSGKAPATEISTAGTVPASAQRPAQVLPAREPVTQRTVSRKSDRPAIRAGSRAVTRPKPAEPEALTDFMAVPYAPPLYPSETARLVRVQVPRATLVPLGVALSPETLGRPVKADVLVGEDGIARAIRFVR